MKRKLITRNKAYLSKLLAYGIRNEIEFPYARSFKASASEIRMTRRHKRRFGAEPDPFHPEVEEWSEGSFFVPCVSSRWKVCHFIEMTAAELESAKAAV